MKRIISAGLFVFMVMLSVLPVYASGVESPGTESGIMSPQFTAILSMSAGLSINSSGKATCAGSVTPSSDTYTADMTVSLEKSTSGGWSSIKSWTGSGTGYAGAAIEAYYYVTSGTYRVCTTVNIYNSSKTLLETESFYSAEKKY